MLQDVLPPEIWQKIYEADPTYRHRMNDCLSEMREIIALLHRFLYATDITRFSRKEEQSPPLERNELLPHLQEEIAGSTLVSKGFVRAVGT